MYSTKDKEGLAEGLRRLAINIEKSEELGKFEFSFENETVEISHGVKVETRLTGWMSVNINIRFKRNKR